MDQNRELEALQARIQETEKRLKAQKYSTGTPGGLANGTRHGNDSRRDYKYPGQHESQILPKRPSRQPIGSYTRQ